MGLFYKFVKKIMKNFILILLAVLLFSMTNKNIIENYSINVSSESRNDYILSGTDYNGAVEGKDPELVYKLGSKIDFIVNAPGHPFLLKFKAGIGKKNQIDGIENNGSSKGTISWTPSEAGTYYYQCGKHKNMVGVIKII